jgi:putative ABC transport system substrate-binding protein
MRRREFIALLGGGAAAWPLTVYAQPPAVLRVGAASPVSRERGFLGPVGFEHRMRDLGYVEGQNFIFDYIDLQGQADRYGTGFQQLIERKADILIASGPEEALRAALAATKSLPIVMVAIDYDPIALGYVSSLARPTGNVTGIFFEQTELAAKRVQLAQDAFPAIRKGTVFWDSSSADQWRATRDNAVKIGLDLVGIELRNYPYDYARALAQAPSEHRGFLFVMTSGPFARDRERIVQFTLLNRLPAMFVFREFVEQGGLLSYRPNRSMLSRRTADYVHRIARGAKPSDLPIERPTTFELVINLRTAKGLGLEFSRRCCYAPTR